jgi:hypothetical protein
MHRLCALACGADPSDRQAICREWYVDRVIQTEARALAKWGQTMPEQLFGPAARVAPEPPRPAGPMTFRQWKRQLDEAFQ